MRNIGLEIAYDGYRYSGWQIQDNALTIQGVLENALKKISKEPVRLKAAGRTDAGVHALGQVASFSTKNRMTPDQFKRAINSLVNRDIRVMRSFEASINFNPRYMADKRWYRYIINNSKNAIPFFRNYSLWLKRKIDIALLNSYCSRITGERDFTSFSTITKGESPIRRIYECSFKRKDDFVIFDIVANSFLRKMVRTIIGTFLDLEKNGENPGMIDKILNMNNRSEAGTTVFAGGLYLIKVFY